MLNKTIQELKPNVSQKNIIDYLKGDLSELDRKKIVKQNEYKLLFEIIELANSARRWSFKRVSTGSYSEIGILVEKILSGEASRKEGRAFVHALRNSHSFYQKVMLQLKNMTPEILHEDVPELNQVKIQPIAETVDFIKKTVDDFERKPSLNESTIENGQGTFIDKIKEKLEPVPTFGYALALIIVFAVGYNFYTDLSQQEVFLAHFTYDTKVPLAYTKSGFKGANVPISEESRFDAAFKNAIADYILRDYNNSVEAFRKMESEVESLPENTQSAALLLDYYLYYGLSHLALSTSSESDISKNEKEQHGDSAINLFRIAKQNLGNDASLKQNIDYFLGVAYWVTNKNDKALGHLKNVSESNEFYENSQLLINRLEGVD